MSGSIIQRRGVWSAAVVLCALVVPSAAGAQGDSDDSVAREAARAKFKSIEWLTGPITGRLGTVADIQIPAGCRLTQAEGSKKFLELTQNIPSGEEVGVLFCKDRAHDDDNWFVIYTYDASGYVKDDEKTHLDSNDILATLRKGTAEGNEERRKRGWAEMYISGWVRPPYYDEKTHNLTWSFVGGASDSSRVVNESVRLLGRGGVLHADLVLSPNQVDSVQPDFDRVVVSTAFVPGSRYSEWREGDKVAAYGLTALIAGGAGAVAMKTGLLAKLGALFAAAWKIIAAAFLALSTRLKRLFRKKPRPGDDKAP